MIQELAGAVALMVFGVGSGPVEPAHARNQVYMHAIEKGIDFDGETTKLPGPQVVDGESAEQERAALVEIAGSDRAADELLKDSITAPYILKVRDVKTERGTVRTADIWFVIHADLKAVDPKEIAERAGGGEVEAGNMAFRTTILDVEKARSEGIDVGPEADGVQIWFAHIEGRLLNRLRIDVTNRVSATNSGNSVVVASRTEPGFAKAGMSRNTWSSIGKAGSGQIAETPQPYVGGMSYGKISRLALKPGALLVELHTAFVEPKGWFDGSPILRSKFGVIAQTEIRTLRRELLKKRGG